MKVFTFISLILLLTSCASSRFQESSGEYVDNAAISVKIKSRLLANKETKGTGIDVESYKGTVILSGFIDSYKERDKAIEIASSVKGVKDVKETLIIKSSIIQ